nr:putative ribonuclease H-like domain-containing protein [Tanacetum cinerariifolium]
IQVAQKKFKKAFENADSSLRVELIPSKIKRLISWQCKKQTIVATSTTEAEYVAAANCCGQATLNDPTPQGEGYTVRSGKDRMEHDIELTDLVPQTTHDLPLSGGHTPESDKGKEIASLKKRITKLEQRQRSRFLGFHPFKAGASKRNNLGRRKVFKHERKNLKSQQMFEDNVLDKDDDTEMIVEDKGNGEKGGSTAETVSTARPNISAARPKDSTAEPKTPPTTTTLFNDEDVTIANTLVKMKNQKAKEKRIAFKDTGDSARPIRSITTLQPLPTIDLKDKCKGILQESEPVKKSKKMDQDQIQRDAEVALKIQADLNEETGTERERQEEASKDALAEMYDEVQAKIDADHELAVRLTLEEQEKYTVEKRSKLLAEFFERRKKQLAKERAEAIRSKPPTKTQLMNLMIT